MDDFVINADGINGFFWFNVKKNDYITVGPGYWPVDDKSPIPVSVSLPIRPATMVLLTLGRPELMQIPVCM